MLALALLLAATPVNDFPFDKGIRVKDHGTGAAVQSQQARGVDCYGALSCSVDGGWLTITAGDAGSGGGGSGAPTTASYITRVAESGLSNETAMGGLGTGLVLNTTTTGTPSIYAGASCTNQFPRSLNASGAATCASVALGTDTTGSYVASVSGNTNEALYKLADAGIGSMSNVETDGTHLSHVAVTAHPAAPASNALQYDLNISADLPHMPFWRGTDGLPVPAGLLSAFRYASSLSNWDMGCVYPAQHGATGVITTDQSVVTTTGTSAAVTWGSGSLLARLKQLSLATGAVTNANAAINPASSVQNAWRGNTSGAGGFLFWARANMLDTKANVRVLIGLVNSTSPLSGNPSALTNTVYFGCDDGDTNLSICSNDNSGTATCSTLGASYPCTTDGAWFDFWLYAAPNASNIAYYIERFDSAASTGGTISSDLPQNSVQMNWRVGVNSGGTNNTNTRIGFLGTCFVANQ